MSANRCPAVQGLSRQLRRAADQSLAKFQAYLAGDDFSRRFSEIPPQFRRRAIQAIADAEARIHDGLPPLVKPCRIGEGRRSWPPAAIDKLARAYALAKGDHVKAGRILRCSTGAARLAKRRHLDSRQEVQLAA